MSRSACFVMATWLLAGVCLLTGHAPAQQPVLAPGKLEYRNVFVPTDKLAELATGYLPIKREEFQQLLTAVNASPTGPGGANVRLTRATYSARLQGGDLVDGTAQLQVQHKLKDAALLGLEPCTLAITKPHWSNSGDSEATSEPTARLGMDAAGRLAVVVEAARNAEQSHTLDLRFGWSLRGARDPAGALLFDLQTPACPTSQLALDLPQGLIPTVSQGLISKLPTTAADIDGKRQPWLVEFGGNTKTTLSLSAGANIVQAERFVLLKQATSYTLSPSALDATIELDLDIHHEPLRQLSLVIDGELEITGANWGDKEIPWSIAVGEDQSSRRLVLEFPEPLQGSGRIVSLTALAPIQWDEAWSLPSVHATGVSWQEGTIALDVSNSVEIRELTTANSRQTRFTARSSPNEDDAYQFQMFSPEGSITILAGHPPLRLQATSGLTLKWDGPNIAGRFVADLSAVQGQTHQVLADIAAGWTIDAVETVPAAALDDWSFSQSAEPKSQLAIRLSQAIQSRQKVRVIMLGHRRAPVDHSLNADEYRMVQLRQLSIHRPLVAAIPEAQQQLGLRGDSGLERLDGETLSEAERSLFDGPVARLLFVDTTSHPDFSLQARNERPRYAAQIVLKATLLAKELREDYVIRCLPEATSLARVLVRLDPARSDALVWRLADEEAGELSARRLTDGEQMEGTLGAGEVWEITLQRPSNQPFELVASRSSNLRPGDAPLALALASLPEADSQTGQIDLYTTNGVLLWMEPSGLKPLTPPPLSAGQTSSRRATFRYSPAQEQRLLVGHATVDSATPALWAWRAVTTAQLNATGVCLYCQRYDLENAGQANVNATLPEGAVLREVRVNGTRVGMASDEETSALQIPLPRDRRYVVVDIDYQITGDHLSLLGEHPLRLIELAAPILSKQVNLWLPPELSLANEETRPSWHKRLFGPLARDRERPAMNLFSLQDWRRELWREVSSPQSQARAQQCLQAWSQLLEPLGDTERPQTLGAWVARYDRLASDNPEQLSELHIDADALAAAGWYTNSPLTFVKSEASLTAADVLREAGLALMLCNDELLLTTNEALLSGNPQQRTTIATHACYVQSRAAGSPTASLPVAAWLAKPETARSPWQVPRSNSQTHLVLAGWRRYELPAAENPQLSVNVYRGSDLRAMAWGWFLVVTALVYWWCKRAARHWLTLCAVSALLALLLPAALAPWGTASFLGTLAAGSALLLLRRRRRTVASPASTMTHAPAKAVLSLLLLALLAACGQGISQAQQPNAAAPPVEAYRVLIPVNDKQEPETDVVYLPKEFYDTLYRLSQAAKAAPEGWIVYDANYRGRMQWDVTSGGLEFSDLVAAYDIEVFQPNTRVTIGLGRENVNLLDDRVNLEQQAVRIEWLASGQGFTLPVEKPGRYRLELTLRPTVRRVAGRAEIDLKIPRSARSQLSLRMPLDAPAVQVSRALGAQVMGEPGELRVDLGPADRLAVHWKLPSANEAPVADVEATQMVWWRIRPGAMVLDAVWKFKSNGQPLREVRIVVDPRLRLLPLDPKEPVAEQFVRDGDVKAIQFVLKEPYEREVTLHTSFALSGSAGVGTLSLPRLSPVADRITRRWLATTTANALEASFAPTAVALEPLSAQEFLTAWGEAEATPQQTFIMPGAEVPITLRIKPREPQVTVVQSLNYHLQQNQLEITLDADCHVSEGQIFQQRVTVPTGFVPTRVEVIDNDGLAVREARAALSSPDLLSVFLPSATSGDFQLIISGKVDAPHRGNWYLPVMTLREAQVSTSMVGISASDVMQVEIPKDLLGYQRREATKGEDVNGSLTLEPLDPTILLPIEVKLAPNLYRWQAQQVLALHYSGDAWQAVLDCHVDVSQGVVRTLRWEIPADWRGPFRANLPATMEVLSIPGQARRQLVAHLQAPQSKPFHFQIAAPVTAAMGERLQAPEVLLLDADTVETFVVLPIEADRQSVAWDTLGLQAVDLPAERRSDVPVGMQSYLVVGARYQASIKRIERLAGVPQVRLADVRGFRDGRGDQFGVASFDLEPAGLLSCQLQMPAGSELVSVHVSDVPALLVRQDERKWQVWLHHEQLPQHVEVVFRVAAENLPFPSSQLTIESPQLVGLPVERSLWTLTTADSAGELRFLDEDLAVNAARQTLFRIKNSAVLLDQAAGTLTDGDSAEIKAWFVPWARVNTAAQAWFSRERAGDEGLSEAARNEVRALGEESQHVIQQWNVTREASEVAAASSWPAGTFDTFLTLPSEGAQQLSAILPGSATELHFQRSQQTNWSRITLWSLAACIFVGLLLSFVVKRWQGWLDVCLLYPQAIGILLGLGWWYWLQPGFVGLAIVLVFTLAAVRWPWPVVRDAVVSTTATRTTRFRR